MEKTKCTERLYVAVVFETSVPEGLSLNLGHGTGWQVSLGLSRSLQDTAGIVDLPKKRT
jgi:hypothetical protein